jgi:hypothetical protein
VILTIVPVIAKTMSQHFVKLKQIVKLAKENAKFKKVYFQSKIILILPAQVIKNA